MVQVQQRYLILGLGLTGLAVARWCVKQGWDFDLCDSRETVAQEAAIRAEFPQAQMFLGELEAQRLCQYSCLIVSPGVALAEPAIQAAMAAGVKVTGDVQIFADHCQKPIVAITGSNGKTTVTSLVGELLQAAGFEVAVGGNIGVPVLSLPEADVYVLELSSFQLETTPRLNAKAATILNISADHLDRYSGLDAYIAAKHVIYNGCEAVVVNQDDALAQPKRDASFGFRLAEPGPQEFGVVEHCGKRWLAYERELIMSTNELKLKGEHNTANVLAALALAKALGVEPGILVNVLKQFSGLEHRCQWLAKKQGVDFINDSKGTNVGATIAAVQGIGKETPGKIWLLLGGIGKGQDFSPLQEVCRDYVREAVIYGQDRKQISQDLGFACEHTEFESLKEAFDYAQLYAQKGDVILLSPACASFDGFKNYEQRGHYFAQLVEALL